MSSLGAACTFPSGMLSIPFFDTAQSHLPEQTTHPTGTPHIKKDAFGLSESVPSWSGRNCCWNSFLEQRMICGWGICLQTGAECLHITLRHNKSHHNMLSAWSDKDAKHLARLAAAPGKGNKGAEHQVLCVANTGLYQCAFYSHGLYMQTKLNGIKLSEYLS